MWRSRLKRQLEIDALADHAAQHLLEVPQLSVDVENLLLHDLLSAERKQLSRQMRRALGGFRNLLDVFTRLSLRRKSARKKLRVALDDGEHIVEIVRDAASQASHSFRLLSASFTFAKR